MTDVFYRCRRIPCTILKNWREKGEVAPIKADEETGMTSQEDLRERYALPTERARLKTQRRLDEHCRNFIAHSPFLCLGTFGEAGADVSPRGDAPGFVRVLDDVTLAIPDWPGNNRLDSMTNLVTNPQVGLLFLIPGMLETFRVNGTAEITFNPEVLTLWNVDGKQPKAALLVTIREAFLHCGKALIRSHLWSPDHQMDRAALPSYGKILKDQTCVNETAEEIDASLAKSYATKLY
jgi:PPOX class probable FMN-dependent enzyme